MDAQELRRYFALFLRWSWLIIICALLGGGTAWVYSSQAIPLYEASTTLLIQRGSVSDETAIMSGEGLARAYSKILTGRPVMEAAIARLQLEMTPDDLADKIKVELVPDTGLMRLSVTDAHPARAAQIANAVADAFIVQNQAMQQARYTDFLATTQEQMRKMSTLIEETQLKLDAVGTPITDREVAEAARLETILAGYRNTYAVLLQNYEDMRMRAAQSADNVVVFETALLPDRPIPSRKSQTMVLAAAVGAMVAVGVAFLVEYLDDTIKSPDDIRQALDLPTLGIIGQMSKKEAELVVTTHSRSPIAEAYRVLRTNIRFSSLDNPLRTLLVTSPSTTEGKSITVANLAGAMVQAGLDVVVMDADLRRPRQHRLFEIERSGGLTEALLDGRVDGNLRSIERVGGLQILPSGELPPNPAELLGSQRMRNLLGTLTERADMVIIDSPPMLPVTDPTVLAQHVDGVLMVVQAGRTGRTAAQHAVERLQQVGANILGVVINAVPRRRTGYHYYYYYYYYNHYYNKYYGGEKKRRKRRRHQKGPLATIRRWFKPREKASLHRSETDLPVDRG